MPHEVSPVGADGQRQDADAAPLALAFDAARRAGAAGEVPVGAVVTDPAGKILAVCGNRMIADQDASAHAEMLAMRMAATRTKTDGAAPGRLTGCDLWVTLEPCAMCAAAAGLFRMRRVLFSAYDPKGGAIEHGPRIFATSPHLHQPEIVGGVREKEAALLLRSFFLSRR
jgi:tRNA(adenine34) deaminase